MTESHKTIEQKVKAIKWATDFIKKNWSALDYEFRCEVERAAVDAENLGIGVMFDGKRVDPDHFFKKGEAETEDQG